MDKQYAQWLRSQISNCQCGFTLSSVMLPHVEDLIAIYRREANDPTNSHAVRRNLSAAVDEFQALLRSN